MQQSSGLHHAHQQLHDVHFQLFEVLLLDHSSLELVVETLYLLQQQLEDALGVDQVAVAVLIGLGTQSLNVQTNALEVAAVTEVVFVQNLDLVEGITQVLDAEGLILVVTDAVLVVSGGRPTACSVPERSPCR